jgi:hypothetical protein
VRTVQISFLRDCLFDVTESAITRMVTVISVWCSRRLSCILSSPEGSLYALSKRIHVIDDFRRRRTSGFRADLFVNPDIVARAESWLSWPMHLDFATGATHAMQLIEFFSSEGSHSDIRNCGRNTVAGARG